MTVVEWEGMALGEPTKARLVLGDDNRVKVALSGFTVPCGDYLTQEQVQELANFFLGLHIAAERISVYGPSPSDFPGPVPPEYSR